MKAATIELSEQEIIDALRAAIEKEGWHIAGRVELTVHPGCSDQRDYQAPYVTAKARVTK